MGPEGNLKTLKEDERLIPGLLLEGTEEREESSAPFQRDIEDAIKDARDQATTLFGTSDGAYATVLASLNLAHRFIQQALDPSEGQDRSSVAGTFFYDVIGKLPLEKVLPQVSTFSPTDIEGYVEFYDVPVDRIKEFIREKLLQYIPEDQIKEALGEDVSLSVQEHHWIEGAPSGLNALIAALRLAFLLGAAGIHVPLAEVLGLKGEVTPLSGGGYQVSVATKGSSSVPGFRFDVKYKAYEYKAGAKDLSEVFGYPIYSVHSLGRASFIAHLSLLRVLDYFFGYDEGLMKISEGSSPLHRAISPEELSRVYFEGPVSRTRVQKHLQELPRGELKARLRSDPPTTEEDLKEEDKYFGDLLVSTGLMDFVRHVVLEYLGEDAKRIPPRMGVEELPAALALISALSSFRSGPSSALTSLLGAEKGEKLRFTGLRDKYVRLIRSISSIIAKSSEGLVSRIAYFLQSGLTSALFQGALGDLRERRGLPNQVAQIFRTITSNVIVAVRKEGARSFRLSFSPSLDSGETAYAAYVEETGRFYINLNPKFFIETSINNRLDFTNLLYSILFHEFLHVYLRHVGKRSSALGTTFGDVRLFHAAKFAKNLHPALAPFVQYAASKNYRNIHTDALINSLSFQMAHYLILATQYSPSRGQGGSPGDFISRNMESRFLRMLLTGFYTNPKLGALNDPSSMRPTLAYVRASSSEILSIRITSPSSEDYDDVYREIGKKPHLGFYLPAFANFGGGSGDRVLDPLFLPTARVVSLGGRDGLFGVLIMTAILAVEGATS